ncbi:MAG TPA: DEAD/DEAH box helicase [Thermoanaerobaculia bacterium]|nr:DEAD/DEAH box helicase [Thermoanaerobaculia bacterium]
MYEGGIAQKFTEGGPSTFAELGIERDVERRLTEMGFAHPTPIQAQVIPEALAGRDLIGLAETGSGKTAAFGLPLVQILRLERGEAQGLILCPTREIALQTKAFLDSFRPPRGRRIAGRRQGELRRGVDSVCLIGGVRIQPQIADLQRGYDILVATPGRLLDHAERGTLSLDGVVELVLDEADHMFDLGFLPQLYRVLARLPNRRRTMLFSATMPEPIERLASRILSDPLVVDLSPAGRAASGIRHRVFLVSPEDKKRCLLGLLHEVSGSTLVFIRRRTDAEWLSKVLERAGHQAERIHADRSQAHRVEALQGFREGKHRILVATDVASRGIDVPGIDHVINFELPNSVEDYIHRAGRTARGAALGTVSSIATWQDKPLVDSLERALQQEIERCSVAGVDAWEERRPARSRNERSPLRRRGRLRSR